MSEEHKKTVVNVQELPDRIPHEAPVPRKIFVSRVAISGLLTYENILAHSQEEADNIARAKTDLDFADIYAGHKLHKLGVTPTDFRMLADKIDLAVVAFSVEEVKP